MYLAERGDSEFHQKIPLFTWHFSYIYTLEQWPLCRSDSGIVVDIFKRRKPINIQREDMKNFGLSSAN